MASLTKIMTAYVAINIALVLKINLEKEMVVVPFPATTIGGTSAML